MKSDDILLELRKFVAPEYVFGVDARFLAGSYCKRLGAERVFVATDAGMRKTPWLQELENSLQEEEIDYIVFDDISQNPRDFQVMAGAQVYKEKQCNLILAIGGGSVIDCAKGIGIVATNNKRITLFEGIDKISNPSPPIICIPTTGGTSADVSQFAIINYFEQRYKMAIISKALVPDVALIDPFVLQSMDSYLTACTGMDALSHAFEAFVSNANSPFTDLYAVEAIRLVHENLMINIKEPNNIQARGKTMLGSLYAGLAFSNASLGCVHSLAHSLGGYLDLPHGECNAILLPHVVDFNFNSAPGRYRRIADIMGVETLNLSDNQVKTHMTQYLISYRNALGIKDTLKDKSVTPDIIPALSKKAIMDPCNATNPKSPVSGDLEFIYKEAL
ncbi:MAG: iron-containing alcohol dehydrogenase [Bacteroidales bacterium]|nr:iron-containing alcohol dehydrogenase [Bacteroidales bacterium]